jgi:hypothetical protein
MKKSEARNPFVYLPSMSKKARFYKGEPGSLRSKEKNRNLGEKNYVDNYYYPVRLVATRLFRWEY